LLIQKSEKIYKNLPDQGFESADFEDDDKEILIISVRQFCLTNYSISDNHVDEQAFSAVYHDEERKADCFA